MGRRGATTSFHATLGSLSVSGGAPSVSFGQGQVEQLQHVAMVVIELDQTDLDHPHGKEVLGPIAVGNDLAALNAHVLLQIPVRELVLMVLLKTIKDKLSHFPG